MSVSLNRVPTSRITVNHSTIDPCSTTTLGSGGVSTSGTGFAYFVSDASSTIDGDQPSTMTPMTELTGMTPRANNLSSQPKPVDLDEELTNISDEGTSSEEQSNRFFNYCAGKRLSRSRLTIIFMFSIFMVATSAIILFVIMENMADDKGANAIEGGNIENNIEFSSSDFDDLLFSEDGTVLIAPYPTSNPTSTAPYPTSNPTSAPTSKGTESSNHPTNKPSKNSEPLSLKPSMQSSTPPSSHFPTLQPTDNSSTQPSSTLPTEKPTTAPSAPTSNGTESSNHPTNKPSTNSEPLSLQSSMQSSTPPSSHFPTLQPTDNSSTQPSTTLPTENPTTAPSTPIPTQNPTLSPTERTSLHTDLPSLTPSLMVTAEPFSSSAFAFNLEDLLEGGQESEEFGYSLAMNGDGSLIAVGARNFRSNGKEQAGLAAVYERQEGENTWVWKGQPILGRKSMDRVGSAVAFSNDGRVLAVAEARGDNVDRFNGVSERSGNIRVFSWNETKQEWSQLGQDIPGERSYSLFGMSMALSGDGSRLVVGAPYETLQFWQTGRVRVFELQKETNSWEQIGQPLDGKNYMDWFGWSVDISNDGQRIAIGAPRDLEYGGYVQIYDLIVLPDIWQYQWKKAGNDIINSHLPTHAEDRFGMSLSLSDNRIAISSPWKEASSSSAYNVGLVAVYSFVTNRGWTKMGSPITGEVSSSQLGMSVSLRGDYLTVGSPGGDGHVSFHHYNGEDWTSDSVIIVGANKQEDSFGHIVVANDNFTKITVGAPAVNHPKGLPGSIRIFTRQS